MGVENGGYVPLLYFIIKLGLTKGQKYAIINL